MHDKNKDNDEDNDKAVFLLRNNLHDDDLVEVAIALVDLCDSSEPPFAVRFGTDPSTSYVGSSLDFLKRTIYLATHDHDGDRNLRSPAAIVVSLAHEVGHMFNPPSEADQQLVRDSPAHLARALELERTAWAWAHRYLSASSAWAKVDGTFQRAREFALKEHERCARW